MPELNWKKIAEIKHALAQERTIICGIKMRLEYIEPILNSRQNKKVEIGKTIEKLRRCDQRLKELECQLVEVIESANGENNELKQII